MSSEITKIDTLSALQYMIVLLIALDSVDVMHREESVLFQEFVGLKDLTADALLIEPEDLFVALRDAAILVREENRSTRGQASAVLASMQELYWWSEVATK